MSIDTFQTLQRHEVAGEIERARKARDFRPTAVLVGHTGTGSFLTVCSTRDPGDTTPSLFWFLQGGIEIGETPQEAAAREAGEEVRGLDRIRPASLRILGAVRYPQELIRHPEEGYTVGKLLIACEGEISVLPEGPHPNNAENIAGVRLANRTETVNGFRYNAQISPWTRIKADFSIIMLEIATSMPTVPLYRD